MPKNLTWSWGSSLSCLSFLKLKDSSTLLSSQFPSSFNSLPISILPPKFKSKSKSRSKSSPLSPSSRKSSLKLKKPSMSTSISTSNFNSDSDLGSEFGFGKRPSKKSLAGFLGASCMGVFVTVFFYQWVVFQRNLSLMDQSDLLWDSYQVRFNSISLNEKYSTLGLAFVSILGGLLAGFSESIDVEGADDNLILPVLAALGLMGIKWGLRVLE